jgi:alpha-glucosidase
MLDVYPGPDCHGEIYLDDGISIGGPNLRQEIQCAVSAAGVVLKFGARTGTYQPWWKEIAVTVHGWTTSSARSGDGRTINVEPRSRTISFTIPDQSAASEITLQNN